MKNKLIKNLLTIISLLALTACSTLGHKNNIAPLPAFTPVLNVHKAWETKAGAGTRGQYLKLTPVVQNNVVYAVGNGGRVTAVTTQGQRLWQMNSRLHLTSGPAVANGMVYVGSEDGHVIAVDARNGALRWKASVGSGVFAAPAVHGKYLVVNCLGSKLYALDANSGALLWNYFQQNPFLTLRSSSSPQINGNMVVAGFPDGELVAFNLRNGTIIWRTQQAIAQGLGELQRVVDIDADPQIRNGVIYAVSYQGQITAISLANGQTLWQRNLSAYSGLAVDSQSVYVTASDGTVWAISRQSGKVIWQQTTLQGRGLTAPVIQGNAIVITSQQGNIHWLSRKDGHFLARVLVGKSEPISSPVAANANSVFVYTNKGRLIKYIID